MKNKKVGLEDAVIATDTREAVITLTRQPSADETLPQVLATTTHAKPDSKKGEADQDQQEQSAKLTNSIVRIELPITIGNKASKAPTPPISAVSTKQEGQKSVLVAPGISNKTVEKAIEIKVETNKEETKNNAVDVIKDGIKSKESSKTDLIATKIQNYDGTKTKSPRLPGTSEITKTTFKLSKPAENVITAETQK